MRGHCEHELRSVLSSQCGVSRDDAIVAVDRTSMFTQRRGGTDHRTPRIRVAFVLIPAHMAMTGDNRWNLGDRRTRLELQADLVHMGRFFHDSCQSEKHHHRQDRHIPVPISLLDHGRHRLLSDPMADREQQPDAWHPHERSDTDVTGDVKHDHYATLFACSWEWHLSRWSTLRWACPRQSPAAGAIPGCSARFSRAYAPGSSLPRDACDAGSC